MRAAVCLSVLFALTVFAGCQQKTPTAAASAPGKAPSWGQGFGAQQPNTPSLPPSLGATPPSEPAADTPGPAPVGGDLAARGLPMAPVAAGDDNNGMPRDAVHSGKGAAGGQTVGPTGMDWGGGDAEQGKRVFGNLCAKCHAMDGHGGNVPNVGVVADLRTANFQSSNTDGAIASIVAHGRKEMPSFAGELNGEGLRNVVAFVRTLKK